MPIPYTSRTYSASRKSSRRKLEDDPSTRLKKKQKIVVEVVQPIASTSRTSIATSPRRGSGTPQNTDIEDTDIEDSPRRVTVTYAPRSRVKSASFSGVAPEPAPVTPRKPKLARDLSQLFEDPDISPNSLLSSPSPHKLAKRMLSRSRTDSSLENSFMSLTSSSALGPLPAPLQLTPTRPSSPNSGGTAAPLPSAAAAATRTYAGKSRSFLVAIPTHDTTHSSLHGELDDELEETRESYSSLRTRWGVDNSEDDPYPPSSPIVSPSKSKGKEKATEMPSHPVVLPNGMMNDLKSITELRSKGETRRFLDEVGYLFEGMEKTGGMSLRRTSALELVTKLCDTDFARKAKAADFFGRIWDVLLQSGAGAGDKILDTILVLFVALVARDPISLAELAQWLPQNTQETPPPFLSTLLTLLSPWTPSTDPLTLISISGITDTELKKCGIGRTEKSLLGVVRDLVCKKSGLFPHGTPVSCRLLISYSLSALSPSLLSPNHHLPPLLTALKSSLHPLSIRLAAYLSGLPLLPSHSSTGITDVPQFTHIERCLRLMDSLLLDQWDRSGEDKNEDQTLIWKGSLRADADSLIALGVVSEIILSDSGRRPEYIPLQRTVSKCIEMVFRVLVSLTHSDQEWCLTLLENEFALPFIMRTVIRSHSLLHQRRLGLDSKTNDKVKIEDDDGEGPEDDEQALDRLCLGIGLLTNLVQEVKRSKDAIREIRIDPVCTSKRACIRACKCPHRISALECIALVFLGQQIKSETEREIDSPEADFLRGHLAVLLGLLIRGSSANHKLLLSALPGRSNRVKLNGLVNQAEEFVSFYAELTNRLHLAAAGKKEGCEEEASTIGGKVAMDRKGEDVARDIVSFLQELRDTH